jgi:hypothetical protein
MNTTPPFRPTTTPCGGNHGRSIELAAPASTEGEAAAGDTEGVVDLPGRAVVVQAPTKAAMAIEMRSFFVTGTSRTLFLEWLTCACKLWFA